MGNGNPGVGTLGMQEWGMRTGNRNLGMGATGIWESSNRGWESRNESLRNLGMGTWE